MEMLAAIVREHLAAIGKRGGKSRSAEKIASSRANVAKAHAALRKKRQTKCAIVQGGGATE